MAENLKLTMAFARSVEAGPKNVEYRDTLIKGFGLCVTPRGARSWFFRQNPYGYKTIGGIAEIGIDRARNQAAEWKLKIRAGQNPFEEIKRQRREIQRDVSLKKPTLVEAWSQYEADVLSLKSESHRRNAARSMRAHFLSDFGNRVPNEVSRKDFLAFREKHERSRPAEMRQMKAYISGFYKWMAETAAYMDFVDEVPHLGRIRVSPRIRTRKLTKKVHIERLWLALQDIEPRSTALAVQFLLLSNRRGIEVRRMTPQEIDLDRGLWEIPAEKNKSGKLITQPLTPKMMEIIRSALGNRSSGFVFSTTQGQRMVTLGHKFITSLVAAANVPHISYHDLRRTMSTGLEELGVPYRVISLTAGHFDAGIEAHYQQAEKRPIDEMLEAYLRWEKYVGA